MVERKEITPKQTKKLCDTLLGMRWAPRSDSEADSNHRALIGQRLMREAFDLDHAAEIVEAIRTRQTDYPTESEITDAAEKITPKQKRRATEYALPNYACRQCGDTGLTGGLGSVAFCDCAAGLKSRQADPGYCERENADPLMRRLSEMGKAGAA